jgi:hypothetical protein
MPLKFKILYNGFTRRTTTYFSSIVQPMSRDYKTCLCRSTTTSRQGHAHTSWCPHRERKTLLTPFKGRLQSSLVYERHNSKQDTLRKTRIDVKRFKTFGVTRRTGNGNRMFNTANTMYVCMTHYWTQSRASPIHFATYVGHNIILPFPP